MKKLKLQIKPTQTYINAANEIKRDNVMSIFLLILIIITDIALIIKLNNYNFPIWYTIAMQCVVGFGIYTIVWIRKNIKSGIHIIKRFPPKNTIYYEYLSIGENTNIDNLLLAFTQVGLEVSICNEED